MRSATVTEFGPPDVFTILEAPDPRPGADELVIAVEVADTLWLETAVRSGSWQEYWPMRPPYVPGNGVAGRVVALGGDVDADLLGARVVAHTGNEGGYADRALVRADAVYFVPDELDLLTAAALLHDAVTALALFDAVTIGPSDAVVVLGASGGLGIASLQLGRARADRVVAVARGPKLDRLRDLGFDALVDSEAPDWLGQTRAALPGGGADVVLDNVGGALGEAAFGLVADGGRFSAHGTPSGRFARIDPDDARHRGITATGIEAVQLSDAELKRYTDAALQDAAAGTITPVIGQTFPLERAGSAHAAIEGRTVFGTTLLTTRW